MLSINYLIKKYKGIYRLKVPYDIITNQFPRKLDGTLEDADVYIDCHKGVQVSYYGKGILQAYIPSIKRGHNILNQIIADNKSDLIFDIRETDQEIIFSFKAKCIDDIIMYLNPKTSGAGISPFSTKNLPKNKDFKMPDEFLIAYKQITQNIPKNKLLDLSHTTKRFIESLATKKNPIENIKADMIKKGLKGKEYIYSIDKWDEYLEYLRTNLR